ncbi:uncharacterized protein [Antedon mediterranea]|uniref:uncharacterized protein n=1 Tax=Antedon mediterranea TaxID=105859 RepID=UPI003AF62A96
MQAQLHRLSLNVDQNLREKSQFNDVTERIFHLIETGDVGELEYYLSTHIKSEIVKHSLFPLHVNRRRQSVSSSAPPFLNVACELGHRSIAALLMEYGANPAQETEKGTPLYVATLNGHESIVQLLVQQKPELLYSVVLVRKALYAAASRGHVSLVKFWTNKLKKMDEFRKNPRFIVGDINPLQTALKARNITSNNPDIMHTTHWR